MGTDVAVRDDEPRLAVLTNEQLQYIARTEFVPPGLRGNLPAILACVATGRAIGIADMTALRSIHIIDGKATFSAELMVQLVRRRGHSITGDVTDGAATVTGTRADNGDAMSVTWTIAMADRAGLLGKSNWKKYPESMLWARAASQLCRMLFADCFAGSTYTPEEIGPDELADADAVPADEGEDVDWVDQPAASAAQKKKLNVLVGQLRDAGHVTTGQLYAEVGREPVADVDGELHWSPLRDSLTKVEAHALIERLTVMEAEAVGPQSWQAVKDLATVAGISADDLAAKGAELFPGKKPSELTATDFAVLWAALEPSEVGA